MKNLFLVLLTMVFSSGVVFGKNVDLKASSLKWTGSKVTGKHFGKIMFKDANVMLEKGELVGGDFTVDMNSFTIDDLKGEWAQKFITHMKSKDFFTVDKYPISKLKIKSVKSGKATADLTIKGKTSEVKFDVQQKGNAYSGVLKFDRTKFGMVYGSGDFFKNLGDKVIDNEVTVDFKFVVKK